MSASHILTPRLALAADNTPNSEVSALLAAKTSSSSSSSNSSHGAKIDCMTLSFHAAAALAAKVGAPAFSKNAAVAAAPPSAAPAISRMDTEEAQRRKEALVADLELLKREFERFQQQPQPDDAQVRSQSVCSLDLRSLVCSVLWGGSIHSHEKIDRRPCVAHPRSRLHPDLPQPPSPTPHTPPKQATERTIKVEFFLGYISRVLQDVAAADPAQLRELEAQAQASLLPLKGKVVAQLAAASASAAPAAGGCMSASTSTGSLASSTDVDAAASASIVASDLMPKSLVLAAGTVRRDDSSFGATSSEGSSGEEEEAEAASAAAAEAPLDDLDMECFSLIMEEGVAAGAGSVAGTKRGLEEDAAAGKAELSGAEAEAQVKRQRSMTFDGKQSREVEYQCSSCTESYVMATGNNPWWALEQQACPKCHKLQIPRVDITLPANTMDYHPALLAEEGDDDDDDEAGGGAGGSGGSFGAAMAAAALVDDFSRVGSVDGEEEAGFGVGVGAGVGPGEEAEEEGATLTPQQAAQLLVLMEHARMCPGQHEAGPQAELCRTVKFLMLHVRDCDGKTLDGEACAFSWCRPCKVLLGHLVRCYDGDKCAICNPAAAELPSALAGLQQLARATDEKTTPEPLAEAAAVASSSSSCCGGHGHSHGHAYGHGMRQAGVTRALSVSSAASAATDTSAASTAPFTPGSCSHEDLSGLGLRLGTVVEFGQQQRQQQQQQLHQQQQGGVQC